ncbi:MAG TPA: flagellar biosynthetic protein FliR, partial [Bacillota bacterium]|nr:flagellar biosynthetic protein FliR [Bacillota bacterium]
MGLESIFQINYTGFLLGFGRASGLIMTAPIFQTRSIPVQIRVLFAFGLALLVAPFIQFKQELLQLNTWVATTLLVQEIMVGLIMGFMMNLTFYAVQISGSFIDVPIGFSMVNILDPSTGTEVPLFGHFNYLLAGLIFLAMNGHHTVIVSFVKSFEAVKPGMFFLKKEATGVFVMAFAQMFLLGFKISIPVMGTIFLTDVALGIIAKLMPQINVFVVGFAIKIVVG